jgi:hypothetical protein
MGCFINELAELMESYNINSIDITANIDKQGKLVIDTYSTIKNSDNEIYMIHKPNQEEYESMFIHGENNE